MGLEFIFYFYFTGCAVCVCCCTNAKHGDYAFVMPASNTLPNFDEVADLMVNNMFDTKTWCG